MHITQPWPIDNLPPPLAEWYPKADLWRSPATRALGRDGGLYVLLHRGQVVYIGQSGELLARFATHAKEGKKEHDDARWWPCADLSRRLQLEGALILLVRPYYNRTITLGLSPKRVWDTTRATFASQKQRAAARPKRKRRTAKDVESWSTGESEGAE